MEVADLLAALNAGHTITGDSLLHEVMLRVSQDALRITGELNGGYQEPVRVRELLSQLTGRPVDESVTVFPPFYSDFGKNISLGDRIFINSGCKFQDQGGVVIGDDCLIGHNVVIATLNHDLMPSRRADLHPAPASVVTKDVPESAIVVGSPARVVRALTD
ncbi:sugar O-acetyltransferase [Pseudarthrobacter sp. AL07]|uniref:sugar O-acetyltransferase n=1 Tax=unclassified Pseudarthrobacter TaxID=2647000 RepID=UPI00249C70C6|nr:MULTISPECIES: sugar O-acetyltransferase [unclassified Pseudarthrobacter]MDI3196052.1 sugar O-acetyltransferase [Pseudarthrobacter sp. AL20]MDI3210123.1 sugar O-acetyltransferase [Pseudarthrobacter sp. AL07]